MHQRIGPIIVHSFTLFTKGVFITLYLDFGVGLDFVWKHLPREMSLDDPRGVFGLSVDQLYRAGIVEL